MASTIWKGSISFGLVNIPVGLHSAVREQGISFKLLREKDHCPLGYERVCKDKKGQPVPWDQVVKGYEYEKGKFVVLSDEDFKKAALATSRTFDIQDFVREDEIDPRYFEKPYYLVPTGQGGRAYALLREAMRETGTVGIGTITLRQKQYLAGVKVVGDALVLDLMRFAAEVLDQSEFQFPDAEGIRPQELKMAQQLVGSLTSEFQPERYRDEYQANLLRIINAKLKGRKVNLKEAAEPEPTGVIDLMERLQKSLERKGGARTAAKKKTGSPAKKSAKRKTA
ncbi:MAG TPA: Ku protein [Longimicrobiaceae bacterium]|nr:Ku protein [Longimicrobiaceae bacterium]